MGLHGVSGGALGQEVHGGLPELLKEYLIAVYFSAITDSRAFSLQRFISIRTHSQIPEHMGEEKTKNSRKINIIATFLSTYCIKYIILFNPYDCLIRENNIIRI